MKENGFHVRIKDEDEIVWESFKQDVIQKHGKLHGVLGDEVMNAIKLYRSYINSDIGPATTYKNRQKEEVEGYM
ncbi:MAG: hypothetical protein MASP_01271 [Candidatus Methanolliviera sp. GoM_asphalt]|nr:MAG: hypothetical protein MASP_01271 [Candidatus Methanolliviera sp. GoM_asphalt]